jgi:outer membrane biosynthesis protein TonB
MRKRTLFLSGFIVLLALMLAGCCTLGSGSASRITPTPTKTLRPPLTSTFTPTATPSPTNTPLPTGTPVPPTATPLPPTDTPVPPTGEPPTSTPEPPTDTPKPNPPTDTPKPRPTNTPAPPTNTPKPQVDFRVVEQRLMSKAENVAQNRIVLIRVADAAGNALSGLVVWDANHPDQETVSGSKPEPYHAEFLFWDYDAYQLEVKGTNSEKTKVVTTDVQKISKEDLVAAGYCTDLASCNPDELVQHFSWYVTFQRTW